MGAKSVLGGKKGELNQTAVGGEPGTGYEAPKDLGEFECENCKYFTKPGSCNQKDMKAKSKLPRNADGSVKVDPEACCSYVVRVGIQDDSEED